MRTQVHTIHTPFARFSSCVASLDILDRTNATAVAASLDQVSGREWLQVKYDDRMASMEEVVIEPDIADRDLTHRIAHWTSSGFNRCL